MKHFTDALFKDLSTNIDESEKRKIHELILKKWGKDTPGKGCIFITPEGKFINLYPLLLDHNKMCDWVNRLGYGPREWDATWFTDELGYIRCRNDAVMCYITLSANITNKQTYAVQDWLEQGMRLKRIDINAPGDIFKTYSLDDYFPEDIIKLIKRYYSSGKLYENKLTKTKN